MQGHRPFYVTKKWEGYKNKLGFISMSGIQFYNELALNIKNVLIRFHNVRSKTSLF
jgi:hypothetical protein